MLRDVALGFAIALGTGVSALSIGVFVYVVVSFFSSRIHTPARDRSRALLAMFRETWLAMFVTPLLLLYVVFGRRMGGGNGTPIVLVHGYTQNRGTFIGIARALARAGLGPIYGFNYWSPQSLRRSSVGLCKFVRRILKETGAKQVDLVAHSMGGIVSLECVRTMPRRVRRVVTIASPHKGVLWPGPIVGEGGAQLRVGSPFLTSRESHVLGVPVLSIASTHDNIVHPVSQSSLAHRGGKDYVVEGPGHLTILFDPEVIRETRAFLGAKDIETATREIEATSYTRAM